ncbi:hypothetical protein GGR57DRAFT_221228 [Xylariaceae sp. FL1272]|nr:hypothetical protein GGR57DRAFT_221228 [Xylariaceae sp. FL1272]
MRSQSLQRGASNSQLTTNCFSFSCLQLLKEPGPFLLFCSDAGRRSRNRECAAAGRESLDASYGGTIFHLDYQIHRVRYSEPATEKQICESAWYAVQCSCPRYSNEKPRHQSPPGQTTPSFVGNMPIRSLLCNPSCNEQGSNAGYRRNREKGKLAQATKTCA